MNVEIMGAEVLAQERTRDSVRTEIRSALQPGRWNPEGFAREQIRGLVRRVFFSNTAGPGGGAGSDRGAAADRGADRERPVRQVVFSAVDAGTEVGNITLQVGEALASETAKNVAVMGDYAHVVCLGACAQAEQHGIGRVQLQVGSRAPGNLWLVPAVRQDDGDRERIALTQATLRETRTTFEYSIVEGPPAGESNAAMAMAQFADGIILVLSAQRTRRVAARKIKEMLDASQVRVLGTVLSDRDFPMPQGIYRRL